MQQPEPPPEVRDCQNTIPILIEPAIFSSLLPSHSVSVFPRAVVVARWCVCGMVGNTSEGGKNTRPGGRRLLALGVLLSVHVLREGSLRRRTDATGLLRTVTDNLRVDSARHAVVQLGIQFRQYVCWKRGEHLQTRLVNGSKGKGCCMNGCSNRSDSKYSNSSLFERSKVVCFPHVETFIDRAVFIPLCWEMHKFR